MSTTTAPLNRQETTRFLNDLHEQLWQQKGIYELRPNMSNAVFKVPRFEKTRDLTKEEFDKIIKAVNNGFLISIISSNFGFSFSFDIWSKPYKPFMRREPRFKPTKLLTFESKQIPSAVLPKGKNNHDDKVFTLMEPYFNNQENLKKLKKFHIELPKKRNFYEY